VVERPLPARRGRGARWETARAPRSKKRLRRNTRRQGAAHLGATVVAKKNGSKVVLGEVTRDEIVTNIAGWTPSTSPTNR